MLRLKNIQTALQCSEVLQVASVEGFFGGEKNPVMFWSNATD
jgi:hypothetical protein